MEGVFPHATLQEVSRTLYRVLQETAARFGNATALRQPKPGTDEYTDCSWKGYLRAAEEVAAGLRAMGLAKGDVVAINSSTSMDFYLADMGILTSGCVSAALYPVYPAEDLIRNLAGVGAKVAIVENPSMLMALKGAPVRRWILMNGWVEGVPTLNDVRETGREALKR